MKPNPVMMTEVAPEVVQLRTTGFPADVERVYIASLADGVPRSANVEHYARIVKEKATLRSVIHAANRILADAYHAEEDADLILDGAEKAIFEIAERDGMSTLGSSSWR